MYLVTSYPMLASTVTTLMLSIIFLILSRQSRKNFMWFWGISWLIYSGMFLLDFVNFQIQFHNGYYIMLR